jgi:formyltetrahydrofolate-dependent phosphoribosylglycinamide formyltransferase
MSRVRVAVLVSGGGTTLQNFVDRIEDGRLQAEIAVVVASSDKAYALERAANHGLPAHVVKWPGADRSEEFDRAITDVIEDAGADLVAMAGFLRLWRFPERLSGRVLNIHPALLPSFGGKGMWGHHVHEAVVASGTKVSGCTVHFADHVYDRGPIILQRAVPVYWEDTPDDVAKRVFVEECEAYPEAINLYAAERLRIEDGRVRVLPPPGDD